ncbi:MAG: peroxide stress protein YaaA [Leptothrix ochracea]|uniref:peroxide stress protein YaaA n=1 Tax=Leptothrix ochracea TaxID=735331 RepID=UPI0034E240F1
MLFLLSPAKSLDFETPTAVHATKPAYSHEAAALMELLRPHTPAQLAELMDVSEALAQLNVARYALWRPKATPNNSKPAVLAFNGDVYDGLQARSLNAEDLAWTQQHLLILSGLYGVLRPLDALQPYRLEMGTRLANPRGKDLYAWWRAIIAADLNQRQQRLSKPVLINLASQEYFKAVDLKVLRARVVECVFEEWQGERWRIVSFHAKRARGLMMRWAIDHRASTPEALTGFDRADYAHDPAASTPDRLVFRRGRGPRST